MDLMLNALREKDQKVALAATEFWSGVVSLRQLDPQQEEFKSQSIFQKLPVLMTALFDCCRFSEFDRMAMIPTREADAAYEGKRVPKKQEEIGREDAEDEEDFEVEENEYFTTLRKSAAFTIERYSSKRRALTL